MGKKIGFQGKEKQSGHGDAGRVPEKENQG